MENQAKNGEILLNNYSSRNCKEDKSERRSDHEN